VHPSENVGMRCTPLMACAGSRKVNTYMSVDLTKPIFGSHA
jgi:hypothetical protein